MLQTRYPTSPPMCTPNPLLLHVLPCPLNNIPYVSLTNPASYPTCGCCSLQENGDNALLHASRNGHFENGHPEIVQALLAAGIDVDHANVSIYLLTPSHIAVGVMAGEVYLPLSLTRCTLILSVTC